MWLSEKLRKNQRADEVRADLGVTTIGGGKAGVYARGEVRGLALCTPGGVCWRPRSGDQVVVLQGGPGGEEAFVLGVQSGNERELEDGEVDLHSGGASLCLHNNGMIELWGQLVINGEPYVPCTCGQGGAEPSR